MNHDPHIQQRPAPESACGLCAESKLGARYVNINWKMDRNTLPHGRHAQPSKQSFHQKVQPMPPSKLFGLCQCPFRQNAVKRVTVPWCLEARLKKSHVNSAGLARRDACSGHRGKAAYSTLKGTERCLQSSSVLGTRICAMSLCTSEPSHERPGQHCSPRPRPNPNLWASKVVLVLFSHRCLRHDRYPAQKITGNEISMHVKHERKAMHCFGLWIKVVLVIL